jgi:ABC-type transport system substrate-binding protein
MNTQEWTAFHNFRITRPNGPIPPGVAGYTPDAPAYEFDLDRARRLLEEAGYPEGRDPQTGRRLTLTLELGSAESAEMRQAAELFLSFMDKIGVIVEPSYNNWPTFLDKMDRRQAQMFRLAWVADYPDAENFLQLFYSRNASPGPNHANYANPEFDLLYEQARVLQDSPERTSLYRQMADIVVEDCPWIFDSIPLSYDLYYDWVRNRKHHDFPYGMEKYLRIDLAGRARRAVAAEESP